MSRAPAFLRARETVEPQPPVRATNNPNLLSQDQRTVVASQGRQSNYRDFAQIQNHHSYLCLNPLISKTSKRELELP
jgi:hypothetical protein